MEKAVVAILLVAGCSENQKIEALARAKPVAQGARCPGKPLSIYGGQAPSEAVKASTVALTYGTRSICSGAIICSKGNALDPADFWVLTAAHCVHPAYVTVGLDGYGEAGRCAVQERALVHPSFGTFQTTAGEQMAHDLALVHVSCDAKTLATAQCVPLLRTDPPKGERAIVAGYGRKGEGQPTGDLLQAQMDVAGFSGDDGFLAAAAGPAGQGRIVLLSQGGVSGICSGDSGGPTYVERDGRLHIAGVHTGGNCNSQPGMSILADVSVANHLDWILATAKIAGGTGTTQLPGQDAGTGAVQPSGQETSGNVSTQVPGVNGPAGTGGGTQDNGESSTSPARGEGSGNCP